MQKKSAFLLQATSGAVLLACALSAQAAAEFGANVELDNTYRDGSAVASGDKGISQAGRVEVGVTAKAGDDMFVAGRTTFLTQKNGTVSTDDMWVQFGNKTGDVKLGRFEAADLFPVVNDTLVNHAGSVYYTNTLRGRMGSDTFHAAGTVNFGSNMSFELGLIDGTKNTIAATAPNAKGVRAVFSFGAGAFSGRVGVESGEYAPIGTADANKVNGAGATGTFDAGSFKLTANYASGRQNAVSNNRQSAMALTVGAGGLGAGFITGTNEKAGGEQKVQTTYVAYTMPLFGVKGASITPAISNSTLSDNVTGASTRKCNARSYPLRLLISPRFY